MLAFPDLIDVQEQPLVVAIPNSKPDKQHLRNWREFKTVFCPTLIKLALIPPTLSLTTTLITSRT